MQCIFANTPVVSPESKNPDWRGSHYIQIVAFLRCHRGAALPSMNGLSNFLGGIQYEYSKKALKAKLNVYQNSSSKSILADRKTFALKICKHHLTRSLAFSGVNHGAIACSSRVISEIFFRVV